MSDLLALQERFKKKSKKILRCFKKCEQGRRMFCFKSMFYLLMKSQENLRAKNA